MSLQNLKSNSATAAELPTIADNQNELKEQIGDLSETVKAATDKQVDSGKFTVVNNGTVGVQKIVNLGNVTGNITI
ncbi:hypothetical protein FACS1894167_10590 [Synergistales bacterium]|nr:hypothetical protein FACS1894167_10590 [Synergistales bacterium]